MELCLSNSTPAETSAFDSSSYAASETPESLSKLSLKSPVSSSPLSSSSSTSSDSSSSDSDSDSSLPSPSPKPKPWSPAGPLAKPAPPVPFYLRFSPAERAFLHQLSLLNGVIDRILPMLNRNPEPSLLSALLDYAARLIGRSGCSLHQRTYYVFRALYRETSALETRPYLLRRATAEVVDYIRRSVHCQSSSSLEWQKKKRNCNQDQQPQQPQQQQQQKQKESLEELLSIVVNVLGLYIDNPRCSSASFAPLTAALQELGLMRDQHLVSLFAFSPAEAKLMRRAVCAEEHSSDEDKDGGGKFKYEYEVEDD